MDGLTLKITNGNRKAIALAKTLLTTPTLINVDIRQGAIYAIPLDVETNQKSASAEVSENLVICSTAKAFISDNVAPGSRSWHLTGYIKGIPRLEPSNYFQPFVQLHTGILWSWFRHGAILTFKDGNAQIYTRVVIKDLQTSLQKDSANATPFTMTLKEINVMELVKGDLDEDADSGTNVAANIAAAGSAIGAAASLGMTTSSTVDKQA